MKGEKWERNKAEGRQTPARAHKEETKRNYARCMEYSEFLQCTILEAQGKGWA
jgi:hypothetical protein